MRVAPLRFDATRLNLATKSRKEELVTTLAADASGPRLGLGTAGLL